jgi:hypothetical protein
MAALVSVAILFGSLMMAFVEGGAHSPAAQRDLLPAFAYRSQPNTHAWHTDSDTSHRYSSAFGNTDRDVHFLLHTTGRLVDDCRPTRRHTGKPGADL